MKKPDDIKKGLFCCWEDGCATCPYDDDCTMEANFEQLAKDSLAYIQQLETRLAQVERERDAAKNDILKGCGTCKYNQRRCINTEICSYTNDGMSGYEWRGVCSENTKEE